MASAISRIEEVVKFRTWRDEGTLSFLCFHKHSERGFGRPISSNIHQLGAEVWERYGGVGSMEKFLEDGNVVVSRVFGLILEDRELMEKLRL